MAAIAALHPMSQPAAFNSASFPRELRELFIRDDPAGADPLAFTRALKACAQLCVASAGSQVHARALKLGVLQEDLFVYNSLMHMYFKCGRPESACQLFDEMPKRTVVSWNCVFAGLADLGKWADVKSLFCTLVDDLSLAPSSFALVRTITACYRTGDVEMGARVHRFIYETGVEMCLNVGNALINMYAKFGDMEKADALFGRMINKDVVSWTTMVSGYASVGQIQLAREMFDMMPIKNVVAWNAIVTGYIHNGCHDEALLLFNEMMVLGFKPDMASIINAFSACAHVGDETVGRIVHGYLYKVGVVMTLDLANALLGMYAKSRNLRSAESLYRRMKERNEVSSTLMMEVYVMNGYKNAAVEVFNRMPYRDLASWNALISILARHDFFEEAVCIFDEMRRLDIDLNVATLVAMLSLCAATGRLELGKWIHDYITKNKIESNGYLNCGLIDMYAKCGHLEVSLEIFDKMPDRDLTVWSTMIGALAIHGQEELALDLFKQMLDRGLEPDGVLFLGVLSSCCSAGLVDEGCFYFHLMTDVYGISPTAEHYSCMVDIFGRQGRLEEAYGLTKCLPIDPIYEPVWRSLLAASVNHGNVSMAKYAAEKLFKMDLDSSGAYVLLSNAYARASMWDDVARIRDAMRKKGVRKVPGRSSIVVAGVVHEFFAGDTSHPLFRDLNIMLDLLEKQMRNVRL